MSSKSNLSNESSRSNLLTLSEDSDSDLKSQRANLYYKKFISKLGFLFRIDTQDLDSLYHKIVECVNEGQGFAQSNDADISELIELAKQLKHNHSLLKNMVEVLDQRFLRQRPSLTNSGQPHQTDQVLQDSPFKFKKTKGENSHFSTPIAKRNHLSLQILQKQPFQIKQNENENDYGRIFEGTLHQAKQEIKKKKLAEAAIEKPSSQFHRNKIELDYGGEKQAALKQGEAFAGSRYEERMQKIFEQLNKIKGELHEIENSEKVIESGQEIGCGELTKKTTQSLMINDNALQLDYSHQVFEQVQEDEYFLVDDRYLISKEPQITKLSLKDLYSKIEKTSTPHFQQSIMQSTEGNRPHLLNQTNKNAQQNFNPVGSMAQKSAASDDSRDKITEQRNTNTSIIESESSNYNIKKADTHDTSSIQMEKSQSITKQNLPSDLQAKGDKSREEINLYFGRFGERNQQIQKYVENIELGMKREEQMRELIKIRDLQTKKFVSTHSESLTNLIYTDYEVSSPKYIPEGRHHQSFELHANNQISQGQLTNKEIDEFMADKNPFLLRSSENTKVKLNHEVVPVLTNLIENNEKLVQISREIQISGQINKNNESLSLQQMEDPSPKRQASVSRGTFEKRYDDQYSKISKKSLNSIEDRLIDAEQKQAFSNVNQYTIPRMTNHSLFDQTRNVESKIELSEDRSHKLKVPGQEIEKIKQRLNEMFKKIKSIKDDTGALNDSFIPESHPKNSFSFEESGRFEFDNGVKNHLQKQGLELKQNQQRASMKRSMPQKQSSFIDSINESKHMDQQDQNEKYGHYPTANNQSPKFPIITSMNIHSNRIRGDSAQNHSYLPIQPPRTVNNIHNSRDSSFSFRNSGGMLGQSSVKSSLASLNQRFIPCIPSRVSQREHSLSRQKKNQSYNAEIVRQPTLIKSSSGQLRPPFFGMAPLQHPVMRSPPPLPPKNYQFHSNHVHMGKPIYFKPLPKPAPIFNKQQRGREFGHNQSSIEKMQRCATVSEIKPVWRNFLQANMAHSVVTNYSNKTPSINYQERCSNFVKGIPQARAGISIAQNLNNSGSKMIESSHHTSKSTSRSRSRKGISVTSEKYKQKQL